jgi:hypothetical protein
MVELIMAGCFIATLVYVAVGSKEPEHYECNDVTEETNR